MHTSNLYFSQDAELQLTIALRLLSIVNNLMRDGKRQNLLFYETEKKLNMHVLQCGPNHVYKQPVPKVSELHDKLWEKQYDAGIDWNEEEGLKLLDELAEYSEEYVELLKTAKFNPTDGRFQFHDPAVYYCMIKHFGPRNIIEIGAGGSTKIASLAVTKETTITAIDPYYESTIQGVHLIRTPVQQIPITEFKKLGNNDILFIDGTHVSKIGSDVNYLLLEVLPELNDGVIVHIHDIYLPDEMPKHWIKSLALFWNEQYLLHAFLIYNSKFKVLLSNYYMKKFHPEALLKVYNNKPVGGGSFWMQKRKDNYNN